MSGAPYNYADATFRLTVRGEGRDDVLVLRPVTPASFVAWSPPGALNTNSMMLRRRFSLNNGDTTVAVTSATPTAGAIVIDSYAPWVPTYMAVVPSSTSTVPMTVRGAAGDKSVCLAPALPAIYALPSVAAMVAASWKLIYNCVGFSQFVDVYVW